MTRLNRTTQELQLRRSAVKELNILEYRLSKKRSATVKIGNLKRCVRARETLCIQRINYSLSRDTRQQSYEMCFKNIPLVKFDIKRAFKMSELSTSAKTAAI